MKKFFLLAPLAVSLLLFSQNIFACSCVISSPCMMSARADAVFVGKIGDVTFERGRAIHTVTVERNFEGMENKPPVEILTDQASSCAFSMESGSSYLIFANINEDTGIVSAWFCSGTKRLNQASKEIAYLESLKSAPNNGGILSGKVQEYDAKYRGTKEAIKPKEIDNVYLEGPNGWSAQTPIEPDGSYRFSNLIGGRYRVSVLAPDRLITTDEIRHGNIPPSGQRRIGEKVKVLGSGCSSSEFFTFYVNGVISGRLLDAAGRPMKRFPVTSFRYEDSDDMPEKLDTVWTNDDGVYVFSGLPPARYLVGFEIGNSLRINSTFAGYIPMFHPNVTNRNAAKHIPIGYNERRLDADIILAPELAKRKIAGRVVGPDGRTAAATSAVFYARRQVASDRIEGGYELKLDSEGRFELEVFDQTEYWILARLFDSENIETRKITESSQCYKVPLKRTSGFDSMEIRLIRGGRNCDVDRLD